MNFQGLFGLIKIELKKLIREPAILIMNLLFPAILTLVFGLTFGAIGGGDTGGVNTFDIMAPGLFAYACIFIIMTVAMSFADEREEGLLRRINVTPISSSEFLGSHIITNMIISIIQVVLVFLFSVLMGFRPLGGVWGVVMAFILMIILSLCSVGLGLLTASIAKSGAVAVGISMIFILPQMFFGTFLPLSPTTEIIALFLPSYYVTHSITLIFHGAEILSAEILLSLTVVSIMAGVIIFIGVLMFKKYGSEK